MSNKVRIIGGKWRGRKINFPALKDLRPTPNRIRETLFNWLAPIIDGADCLDLFAGSGALGFEALSRGAGQVIMVDTEPQVIAQLKVNQQMLDAENLEILHMNAEQYIAQTVKRSSRKENLSSRGLTAGSRKISCPLDPPAVKPRDDKLVPQNNNPEESFDIIFLDPPFQKQLIPKFCQLIAENNLLKSKGYVYIETDSALSPDDLPPNWQIIKQKQAGKVWYYLLHREKK